MNMIFGTTGNMSHPSVLASQMTHDHLMYQAQQATIKKIPAT